MKFPFIDIIFNYICLIVAIIPFKYPLRILANKIGIAIVFRHILKKIKTLKLFIKGHKLLIKIRLYHSNL